uniref:Uncharacterized protein n=1 Tax=Lactuca sativa TaxID=4236 RepID=A0A9R1WGZ0_LACSA|nr:hypothetical protein LSAT_V11C100028730 [Lactuca sativa]
MFLHLDNRGEYLLTNITNYLKEHKIKHLGEIRRIMLHDKNVSWRFWTKAMQTSAYYLGVYAIYSYLTTFAASYKRNQLNGYF